jgi:hypothetical protein
MFFQDETLSALDAETHILAAGLLCYADDDGYFNANPRLVQAAIFPLRDLSRPINDMLTDLSVSGYIRIGEAEDGKTYGHVVNFSKHQRINRKTPSVISNLQISWRTHTQLTESSQQIASGIRNKEGNKEGNKTSCVEPEVSPQQIAGTLPLNNNSDHTILKTEVAQWGELYPGIDIKQELRNMKGWLLANPTRRKTKTGINKFINNWLAKAQNGVKSNGNGNNKVDEWFAKAQRELEAAEEAESGDDCTVLGRR